MLTIYSAEICPFAQRTRALLNRINVQFQLEEIDLTDKPEEFKDLSPTGKVPMLRDGDFLLYESQVINDYLIELHDWEQAYSSDTRVKYRQKLAMKQWDSVILGPFYESLSQPDALDRNRDEIEPELNQLNQLIESMENDTDNILSFHVAPFWARMRWLSEYSDFSGFVKQFDQLHNWLKATLEEPPIRETLPDREYAIKVYRENYVG